MTSSGIPDPCNFNMDSVLHYVLNAKRGSQFNPMLCRAPVMASMTLDPHQWTFSTTPQNSGLEILDIYADVLASEIVRLRSEATKREALLESERLYRRHLEDLLDWQLRKGRRDE